MAQKISVVIPNFNGEDLLAKNLPNVLKHCKGCELIVIDDASTDQSVNFLNENYKNIKIIQNVKNLGFARTANLGVRRSKGKYIILLNSDVSPRKEFLKIALKHFKKQKSLFAVAFMDKSHEDGKIISRGKGGGFFKRGLFSHFKLPSESGETLWVSGGSGVFDKDKFLELGGFDSIFSPFYWEDIDLSFRAWLKGYRCIFEPQAVVDHYHSEGVIKKNTSEFYLKIISYKNMFIFQWKNITDYFLTTQHLIWFPFHLFKSLLNLDITFLVGFILALISMPKLIFTNPENYSISDKEIIKKFEK